MHVIRWFLSLEAAAFGGAALVHAGVFVAAAAWREFEQIGSGDDVSGPADEFPQEGHARAAER